MATIGLDKLYYAKITEDASGNETYGDPQPLAKAMTAELSVELAEATLYADDGAAAAADGSLQQTVLLKHPQRLPHDGAAALELLGQLPLGGKAVSGFQFPGNDLGIDLLIDDLRGPLGFRRREQRLGICFFHTKNLPKLHFSLA